MFDMRIKEMFFDRKAVIDAVDKAKRAALSRGAAFIRTAARSSIRKRKKPSPPGSPPSSHTGLLRRILFGWDPSTKTVVVGPMKTNQVFFDGQSKPVTGTVPGILERGGQVKTMQVLSTRRFTGRYAGVGDYWVRADLRSKRRLAGRPMRMKTSRISARPYMGPALKQELPKLPKPWANSVRG